MSGLKLIKSSSSTLGTPSKSDKKDGLSDKLYGEFSEPPKTPDKEETINKLSEFKSEKSTPDKLNPTPSKRTISIVPIIPVKSITLTTSTNSDKLTASIAPTTLINSDKLTAPITPANSDKLTTLITPAKLTKSATLIAPITPTNSNKSVVPIIPTNPNPPAEIFTPKLDKSETLIKPSTSSISITPIKSGTNNSIAPNQNISAIKSTSSTNLNSQTPSIMSNQDHVTKSNISDTPSKSNTQPKFKLSTSGISPMINSPPRSENLPELNGLSKADPLPKVDSSIMMPVISMPSNFSIKPINQVISTSSSSIPKSNKKDISTPISAPHPTPISHPTPTSHAIPKSTTTPTLPNIYELPYLKALFYTNPTKWQQELKEFLSTEILPQAIIISNTSAMTEIINKLVTPEAMEVWITAFTSKRWDPNLDKNYERLEYLGDSVMRLAFDVHVTGKYPQLTQADLTPLRIHYLSKVEQGKLSRQLGLVKHGRTPMGVDQSLEEDLLESLFGALYTVGDMSFKKGMGYGLAYNLLVKLFDNIELDLNYTIPSFVTVVKNIYEQAGWGKQNDIKKYEEYNDLGEGKWQVILKYPPLLKEHLQINENNIVDIEGLGRKKDIKELAYEQTYRKLRDAGITSEWAIEFAKNRERNQSELAPYYPATLDKAKEEGFDDVYFSKKTSRAEEGFTQLVGVKANDIKEILWTLEKEKHEPEVDAKARVLQLYAKYGKEPRQLSNSSQMNNTH